MHLQMSSVHVVHPENHHRQMNRLAMNHGSAHFEAHGKWMTTNEDEDKQNQKQRQKKKKKKNKKKTKKNRN